MSRPRGVAARPCHGEHAILRSLCELNLRPIMASNTACPPLSSIPRTSAHRLASACPAPCPDAPVPASAAGAPDAAAPTVLYLAYGSNLSAETFLGRRGIRPVSQVNVSAPSLRLTFDLPGVPYLEPCFANTGLRKAPGLPPRPPKLPPTLPDPPAGPRGGPPRGDATREEDLERQAGAAARGDPDWAGGLIGVVYEVTRADYATILATEGGGSAYQDILVPCLALPAPVSVPEKPPVPELPRPFLAHTLYAPQVPAPPRDGGGGPAGRLRDWWRRQLLKPVRPDPEYAQPSARYLKLMRDGAREHELPAEYQAWLAALRPYAATTLRQRAGQLVVAAALLPLVLLGALLQWLLADEGGKGPWWVNAFMVAVIRGVWMAYDAALKPVFGDGERRVERGEGGRRPARWEGGGDAEKMSLLMRDW